MSLEVQGNVQEKKAIFKKVDGELNTLFVKIDFGDIGLPELQRPFVWEDKKVRDLFDSMYQGFPIGYFLFWENKLSEKSRQIGSNKKENKIPSLVIIDGQQRLTALYSVFRDQSVLDKDYKYRKIKVAFNPVTEEFQVVNASTQRNKEYIENISTVYKEQSYSFITNYLKQLDDYRTSLLEKKDNVLIKVKNGKSLNSQEIEFIVSKFNQIKDPSSDYKQLIDDIKSKPEVDPASIGLLDALLMYNLDYNNDLIASRIQRLANLGHYQFQALEIDGEIEEEKVAEIFTRINSKGVPLNQADFVLTLISVFWEEGRRAIDEFCGHCKKVPEATVKDSPYNYLFEPDAQDITRINIGIGFKRGRMKDAYAILKGRDLTTRRYSDELRESQFEIFKEKQKIVLDNMNWHNFLKIIMGTGFKSKELISSNLAVINAYILYLIGKTEHQLDHKELEQYIGRWFFMSTLTSRYSSSPESQMEADLNKVKLCKDREDFKNFINLAIANNLTNDFWEITLPNDLLATSSANSPAGNTFFACHIKRDVRVLFSVKKVRDLFDPALKMRKKSLDKHHIFPSNHLKQLGYEQTMRNQIANKTFLEFQDNISISDDAPIKYYNDILSTYPDNIVRDMSATLKDHCLPENFCELDYEDFLTQRRKLMAKFMRDVFEKHL